MMRRGNASASRCPRTVRARPRRGETRAPGGAY
ncbi:hypothetical protein BURPS305_7106 [Burkholderia pseudomallei 305]|nr:hypothetical protein BURPS305_7106 [Burkholderia pseudomallei 305]